MLSDGENVGGVSFGQPSDSVFGVVGADHCSIYLAMANSLAPQRLSTNDKSGVTLRHELNSQSTSASEISHGNKRFPLILSSLIRGTGVFTERFERQPSRPRPGCNHKGVLAGSYCAATQYALRDIDVGTWSAFAESSTLCLVVDEWNTTFRQPSLIKQTITSCSQMAIGRGTLQG